MDLNMEFIKLIANERRLKIIFFLANKPEASVNEIASQLNIPQSSTSEHISILKKQELVTRSQEGNFVFYKLNNIKIAKELNILSKHLQSCC